jgi:hypothetical protein
VEDRVSLLDAITKDRGQPSNIRVGTVVGLSPIQVSVQGTIFADVGVLNDYAPQLGDTVLLAGQSAVSADGSSWVVLGASSGLPSPRPDVRVLAAKSRTGNFDSATFTTTEVVIGGSWNLTVPLPGGHLVELFMTLNAALTTGVNNQLLLGIREDSISGTVVYSKNHLCGPGNNYYAQTISVWVRPPVNKTQLYVLTARAPVAGTGQINVGAGDIFIARDHGLVSTMTLV